MSAQRPVYPLRAHHGLCLHYFKGKGYSGGFVRRAGQIKSLLEEDPDIRLTEKEDLLCAACPHMAAGQCGTREKAERYDRKVLGLCGLEAGVTLRWSDFARMIQQKILQEKKRRFVCADCEWDFLCGGEAGPGHDGDEGKSPPFHRQSGI